VWDSDGKIQDSGMVEGEMLSEIMDNIQSMSYFYGEW
jgi:hypothetical protein